MVQLLALVMNAVAIVLVVKSESDLAGSAPLRTRRVPWAAIVIVVAVAVPSLAQQAWPGIQGALDCRPADIVHHGQVWRLLTAALVQDGGIGAVAFNLVSLALVAPLADWSRGPRRTLATFVVAAVGLNALEVAFDASGAGSSGATFALGASVAAVLIVTGHGPVRARAVAVPVLGLVMLAVADYHGLALIYGVAIGLTLHALDRRHGDRARATVPHIDEAPSGSPAAPSV